MVNRRNIIVCFIASFEIEGGSVEEPAWLRRMQVTKVRRMAEFRRLQAQQRFFYILLLSVVALQCTTTVQISIWIQERSYVWWDRIVHQCFNDRHCWRTSECPKKPSPICVSNVPIF